MAGAPRGDPPLADAVLHRFAARGDTGGRRRARCWKTRRGDDGSTRQRIRVTLDTPNRRSFEMWLWLPAGDGPFPLLLTAPRDYQIPWAELAVQRGYAVCLYPGVDSHHREPAYPGYDSIWQTFRDEYPQATWTEILTKAWLAGRTLDFLLDAERGYPLARAGRHHRVLAVWQASDARRGVGRADYGRRGAQPRFARVVSRIGSRRATRLPRRRPTFPASGFCHRFGSYTGREHQLPMDAHGWYALIAPRRLLVHTALQRRLRADLGRRTCVPGGTRRVSIAGRSPDHLRIHYRPGAHSPITDEHRRQNLDWFDLAFGRGDERPAGFSRAFAAPFRLGRLGRRNRRRPI
jgi:hypothetical protein